MHAPTFDGKIKFKLLPLPLLLPSPLLVQVYALLHTPQSSCP